MTLITDFLENSSRNYPQKTALIFKDSKLNENEKKTFNSPNINEESPF